MTLQNTFRGLEPYAKGLGVGKWDRFMTYGRKIQEGIPFDFTPETFCQIVDNFSRVYSMRRLGMDYRHDATQPQKPGPEQNLAYYSGLAVIWDGKVIKLWDHFPDRVPPDPKQLLLDLQQNFPRNQTIESVGGLWGYKCEVTPLGEQALPNCEQLSPLFSKDDHDEYGNPIGYNLLNVSAVGVAFQNGTFINLAKSLSRNTSMNEKLPKELMAKLAKHGMGTNPEPHEIEKVLGRYMAETEDGPMERKAMAEACAAHLCKMDQTDPDGSQATMNHQEPDGDERDVHVHIGKAFRKAFAQMNDTLSPELMAKLAKHGMSDNPEPHEMEMALASYMAETEDGPMERKAMAEACAKHMAKKMAKKMDDMAPDGSQADMAKSEMIEDEDKKGQMSKLAAAQARNVAALAKQNHELSARIKKIEQEKADAQKTVQATAFARRAVEEGRWPADGENELIGLAKAGQGELAIKPYQRGTFTVHQKWTNGGAPKSNSSIASSTNDAGNASQIGNYLARGSQLSAMAKVRATEKGISLGAAQLEIYKEHPEFYADQEKLRRARF